jgi:hypothetical protein
MLTLAGTFPLTLTDSFIKHSSHIGRAAVPTLFKDFIGGPIYWGVFYFTAVVSKEVESTSTESTCTAVESTVVNLADGVTLLQLTATKAITANTKTNFFIFFVVVGLFLERYC